MNQELCLPIFWFKLGISHFQLKNLNFKILSYFLFSTIAKAFYFLAVVLGMRFEVSCAGTDSWEFKSVKIKIAA